jgi:predicted GTPase
MGVPQVVIVSRPNVGKSACLTGWWEHLAIVDQAAGVTCVG